MFPSIRVSVKMLASLRLLGVVANGVGLVALVTLGFIDCVSSCSQEFL